MNELEVFKTSVAILEPPKAEVKSGAITFDLANFKTKLDLLKEKITSVEITIDTIDEFKSLRAKLNSFSTKIDDEKKRVKKEYNVEYTKYENEVKECKKLVDDASNYAKEQIQSFERQFREDKKEELEQMWAHYGKDKEVPFIRIEKQDWYLKKYSNKMVAVEMTKLNDDINEAIETITKCIDNGKERERVIKNYYLSLDAAKELGEYYRWKNIIETEPVIVERPVEATTPKEPENAVEPKYQAKNEEIKEVVVEKPAGVKYNAVIMITAEENIIKNVEEFLNKNNIEYQIGKERA